MKIVNKRALHDYFIIESIEAGIELLGVEVKSIRTGRVELGQSAVKFLGNEIFLVNAHIPAYLNSPVKNYNPSRSRRLLLRRSQIENLIGKSSVSKRSLVPVSIYDKNNLIKVEIGLARSKKEFDHRKVIKERDNLRRVEQELRGKE